MPICGCSRSDVAESPTRRPPEDNPSAQRTSQDTSRQRTSATARDALSQSGRAANPLLSPLDGTESVIGVDLRDPLPSSSDLYQRRRRAHNPYLPPKRTHVRQHPQETQETQETVEERFNRGTVSRRLAPNFSNDLPLGLNHPQADIAAQPTPDVVFPIPQVRTVTQQNGSGGEEISPSYERFIEQISSPNSFRPDGEEESTPAPIADIY